MTIIAGFRCIDGVVVCGDTQETSDIHKRNVTKVIVFPPDRDIGAAVSRANVMAAFCGAGNGDFIEVLIRKAWESTTHAVDLDQACDFIEITIKDVYKEYGEIYQSGNCPSVSLIYGVKMYGGSRLFRAVGPIVNPVPDCTSNGQGYFLADFLASRMYNRNLTAHQCAILAAYILFQAKEHVDGCGGDSHIAILSNTGRSGLVNRHRVQAITNLVDQVDKELGDVLIQSGILTQAGHEDTMMALENSTNMIQLLRDSARQQIESGDFARSLIVPKANVDEFGFGDYLLHDDTIKPSDP